MKHENFILKGDEMQIFDSFPFTIITDCDGTELVYIRRRIHDDTTVDVIFCAGILYDYACWTIKDLEQFVEHYCLNNLSRKVGCKQYTSHLILPTLELSDFAYGVNGLQKLTL